MTRSSKLICGSSTRDFFDQAERKRRWCIQTDIPWTLCNKNLGPPIADIVESFCVVELYLPDYLRNAIPRMAPQPCSYLVLRQLGLRKVETLAGPE